MKFHLSSRNSEILHLGELLLWKSYKVLAKKVQKSYLSLHWKVMQSLKKNWLVVVNLTWVVWWIFTQPFKFHFAIFVQSIWDLSQKKIQRSYLSWYWTVMQNLNKPWPCGFKNGMSDSVNWIKVWKIVHWWALFKKFQRNYVSWYWRMMQNLKENWLVAWKIT